MKKIFLTAVFTLVSILSFGQETEHLKFMGIPIDGSLTEFNQKLIQKGFKKSDYEQLLTGKFAQENVELAIYTTPKTKKVYRCAVVFGECSSWYSLKAQYEKFKESITNKYGEPIKNMHYFDYPYYEGDGYEMSAIKLDKCNYASMWNNGIHIFIGSFKKVVISYTDKINEKLNDEEKNALINDDL